MQKYVLLMMVVWGGMSGAAQAATATLAWDPGGEGAAGYTISYGIRSGVHTTTLDVGNTIEHSIRSLVPGSTYYFVVRAYGETGVLSNPSNEGKL